MRPIWLVIAIILVGGAIAQTALKLVINGKTASSGWINLNGKVYIPLEALQKAGVNAKKSGNTYTLSLPKATTLAPMVVPKPIALVSAPKPVSALPVSPIAPVVVTPTFPPPPVLGVSGKIVVSTTTKPLLEGCISQSLNNGVWLMRILNFAPLIRDAKFGYLVSLEYSNVSVNALSLFDTGFSDGEGGAGNFTLQLQESSTLASSNTDAAFIYNVVQPNSKASIDIFFLSNQTSLPTPQRFIVGQERRVTGFTVSDPSLRFKLDCR